MTISTAMNPLMAIAAAAVATPAAPAATLSPLIGAWSVDVTRLPIPPEARPKRVTITFSPAADRKLRIDVDIVDAAGQATRQTSTSDLAGTPAPIQNGLEADIVAVRSPGPGIAILALGKGGIPASTRIYAVQPGGRVMIETAVYFGEHGKPIMRTNHFTRIR